MPHSHNYYNTLIIVADDCPVGSSIAPSLRNGKQTIATLQYEMIIDSPFTYSQEDVLFATWLRRQDPSNMPLSKIASARKEFLATPKPCLRTSPLAKKYGWGFLFDADGRVKLLPSESELYRDLQLDGKLKVIKAMKSSR